MAITSYGYPGTINSARWSVLQKELGSAYSVQGQNDWKVAAVVGLDRTVSVAAGQGFGAGVLDVNSAAVNVQLDIVASGTRWDLIVARRNWGGTPVTTFVKVNGTATATIPSGRLSGPGDVDDQPLALVQVTAGQTAPTGIVDLRTWASKLIVANDLRALVDPEFGAEARVGGIRYQFGADTGGSLGWQVAQPVPYVPPSAPLIGTYDPSKPLKFWVINEVASPSTTANTGDWIVLTLAQIGTGCVLGGTIGGASTFGIIAPIRNSQGNVVARIQTPTGVVTGGVAITGLIVGQ